MSKYIHSTRDNVHIINLNHTVQLLSEALKVIDSVVSKGGKILFVATKNKQQKNCRTCRADKSILCKS